MKNIYLYAHGGSANHGCEAIVRSTLEMLKKKADKKILISSAPKEDEFYEINRLCEVVQDVQPFSKGTIPFLKAYLQLKLKKDYIEMDKLQYQKSFKEIKKGDWAFSIGGDNYCYADVQRYIMMHDMLLKKGVKTALWGCSVEPKLIKKPEIAQDLAKYDLITARESISYEALKKINSNTVLVSDPAFTLKKNIPNLHNYFQKGNMVGVNVSPMVIEREAISGVTLKNYEKLIEYILNKTDMGIALIPHVIWSGMDDREPLRSLYKKYKDSKRVVMVEDCNCMKLKGIISQCRFFVGARTHATIAAYSTGIPTLVVGYSVKARGIARDLFGTDENYVLPVQKLSQEIDLLHAFQYIYKNENKIKSHLEKIIPEYCLRAYRGLEKIEK